MKSKLFYLLVVISMLVFASCNPLGEANSLDTTKKESPTTYTVTYNIDSSSLLEKYISLGATIKEDLRIEEYNAKNEVVNIKSMENISYGTKKKFTAHSLAEKIAICWMVEATYNGKSNDLTRWVGQVFYLERESNTNITIDGETWMDSSCPVE